MDRSPSIMVNISPELRFKTSRSGGKGGQHVNKTETKVELIWDVTSTSLLEDRQKDRLRELAGRRMDEQGLLHIVVEQQRSQLQNKRIAMKRLEELLLRLLHPPKRRIATRPSRSKKRARLKKKKLHAEKKKRRRDDKDSSS